MVELLLLYIFIGIIAAVWSFAWAYPDAKAPVTSYILIILIWPYQVYLQWRYKNDN